MHSRTECSEAKGANWCSVAFKSCVRACVCVSSVCRCVCSGILSKAIRYSSIWFHWGLESGEVEGDHHCPFVWGTCPREIVCFPQSLCVSDICSVYQEHTVIQKTQADDNSIWNATVGLLLGRQEKMYVLRDKCLLTFTCSRCVLLVRELRIASTLACLSGMSEDGLKKYFTLWFISFFSFYLQSLLGNWKIISFMFFFI